MRHQDNSERSRLIISTGHTKDGDDLLRVIEEKTKTHEGRQEKGHSQATVDCAAHSATPCENL